MFTGSLYKVLQCSVRSSYLNLIKHIWWDLKKIISYLEAFSNNELAKILVEVTEACKHLRQCLFDVKSNKILSIKCTL